MLGTFIGTFLYSLLVLRTVQSTDESPFVPHLAVTLGLVLTVISVAQVAARHQLAIQIIDTAQDLSA